jgi:hypothetical protein
MKQSHRTSRSKARSSAAILIAVGALASAAIGLLSSLITYKRAVMPYNSEGNYFDGMVNYHSGAQFIYGFGAVLAFVVAVSMFWLMLRLLRPNNSFKPRPLRDSA